MKFQIIDSFYNDQDNYSNHIKLFCRNEQESVIIIVNKFKPYFYTNNLSYGYIDSIIQKYKNLKINTDFTISNNESDSNKLVFSAYGKNKNKKFNKLIFNNFDNYKKALRSVKKIGDKEYLPIVRINNNKKKDTTDVLIYENKIDPLLRFFHNKEINPCGWISIPDNTKKNKKGEYFLNYEEIEPCDESNNAKFVIMSYDIECESSHGDFPLANKDYSLLLNKIDKEIKNNEYKKEKIIEIINQFFIDYSEYLEDNINVDFEIIISKLEEILKEDNNCSKNKELLDLCNKSFPNIKGDRIVQIGTCFMRYGETKCYKKHIVTFSNIKEKKIEIESDDDVPIEIERFDINNPEKAEIDLLNCWFNLIKEQDPDIITGYNIYNFDGQYIFNRSVELGLTNKENRKRKICNRYGKDGIEEGIFNRINKRSKLNPNYGLIKTDLIDSIGRIQLDIFPYVQKNYSGLSSYKLDNVSANFITGKISYINKNSLTISDLEGLHIGNFIQIKIHNRFDIEDYYLNGKNKFEIIDIKDNIITICSELDINNTNLDIRWCLGKDDIKPIDIFKAFKKNGTEEEKMKIAKYCMMDTVLCIELLNKLKIVSNLMSMANVCYCPLKYIILRGEGIKTLSLVSKKCQDNNYILKPLVINPDKSTDYEGATVLRPEPGLYLNHPVSVLDYTSLYPSSMISRNLSHETFVKIYDDNEILTDEEKLNKIIEIEKELKEQGYKEFNNQEHNIKPKKYIFDNYYRKIQINNDKTYIFIENKKKGIIPTILQELMNHRKETKKLMKNKNLKQFEYDLLDSKQLAYKLTANSIYGQMGSKYSQVFKKEIAESTTAIGREQLEIAKTFVLNHDFKEYNKEYNRNENITYNNKVVYGDTDSIFVKYDCLDDNGNKIIGGNIEKDKELLKESIRIAQYTEKQIGEFILESPQVLEYEKTFYPFILLGKKKYIGMKYEFDVDKKPKQTNMGVVLKRRDNAPILKIIYDGVIDKLINDRCVKKAYEYLNEQITELKKGINSKYDITKLTITKRLNASYKDRTKIAHAVLADRIADRDPGNKPNPGDRILFVYIKNEIKNKEKILQGDKIEIPEYIIDNNLEIDYDFYISNQIKKPISQLFAICDINDIFKEEELININNEHNKNVLKYKKKKTNEIINTDELKIKVDEYTKKDFEKKIGDVIFNKYKTPIEESIKKIESSDMYD